jgi:hypothetical protein
MAVAVGSFAMPGGFGSALAQALRRTPDQILEPLNDNDPFLQGAGPGKDRLIVRLGPPSQGLEPDSLAAVWDIVLDRG